MQRNNPMDSKSVPDKRVFRAVEGIYGELDTITADIRALTARFEKIETSNKSHEAQIDHLMEQTYPVIKESQKKTTPKKVHVEEDLIIGLQVRCTNAELELQEKKTEILNLYREMEKTFQNGFKKGHQHARIMDHVIGCNPEERRWDGNRYMTKSEFMSHYDDIHSWNGIGGEYGDIIKPVASDGDGWPSDKRQARV